LSESPTREPCARERAVADRIVPSWFGTNCTRRSQLSSALAHIAQLLENPFVAAALGLLLAFLLLRASKLSFHSIDPDEAPIGVAIAAIWLFGRLVVMTLSLWAYKRFFYEGFKPFAFALAGGFLVLYAFELVRFARLQKHRKPTGVRH
jgi:hypothetical protein